MATLPNHISNLSQTEKLELLDAIWEDLESHASISPEQADELDRRIAAYDADPEHRNHVGAGKGRIAQAVKLPVVWLEEAVAEFYDAEQWYAGISVDLSRRFVFAVEETVYLIADFPLRFPVIHRDRRRAGVKRFPYGLFYVVEADRIVLIACFHGKRNPSHWRSR